MIGPKIFRNLIPPEITKQLAEEEFEDMIKFVVDLDRKLICAGGGMHSDEEQLLIDDGSVQENLWGANYYPNKSKDSNIDFISMINVRPKAGNKSQEIRSEPVRKQVEDLARYFFESNK